MKKSNHNSLLIGWVKSTPSDSLCPCDLPPGNYGIWLYYKQDRNQANICVDEWANETPYACSMHQKLLGLLQMKKQTHLNHTVGGQWSSCIASLRADIYFAWRMLFLVPCTPLLAQFSPLGPFPRILLPSQNYATPPHTLEMPRVVHLDLGCQLTQMHTERQFELRSDFDMDSEEIYNLLKSMKIISVKGKWWVSGTSLWIISNVWLITLVLYINIYINTFGANLIVDFSPFLNLSKALSRPSGMLCSVPSPNGNCTSLSSNTVPFTLPTTCTEKREWIFNIIIIPSLWIYFQSNQINKEADKRKGS